MQHVGIRQARQRLPWLVDQAIAGEEVVITRQGVAVAKLVAMPARRKALPSLLEFRRATRRMGTSSASLLREERNVR